MEEIEFSWWLFEGSPRQCKNVLLDGLNWLLYFAGSSKSHHENSIFCTFLESPEKYYQMLERLFVVFCHSKNIPWALFIHNLIHAGPEISIYLGKVGIGIVEII